MLKQRILTALVLAPLVVWGIVALPTSAIAVLFGAFVLVGGWEWTRLIGLSHAPLARAGFIGLMFLCLLGGTWMQWPGTTPGVLSAALVWWLVALSWVVRYPHGTGLWVGKPLQVLAGVLILVPTWWALVALHGHAALGAGYVLYLLVLVWGADIGAYFSGRQFGKHKLAPAVSPGKTWEGVAGALAMVVLIALAGAHWLGIPHGRWPLFIALSLAVALFSVLGDLVESMYKRQAGVKDSGTLLPGHGGVLDRIDSVTAAAPMFALGLWVTGLAV